MMTPPSPIAHALLLSSVLAGCDYSSLAPEPFMAEAAEPVRAASDPDFEIYLPDSVPAGGGILIYDIQNGFVYEGDARNGKLLLNVHDGGIYDSADSELLCQLRGDQLFEPKGPIMSVLYSAGGNAVYEGEQGSLNLLLFAKADQACADRAGKQLIATTSEDLSRMSTHRLLLVAALLTAKCGAPPLPLVR